MSDPPSHDMLLATSTRLLDAILTESTDHIYVLDRAGRFVHASLVGAQALSMERTALIGKTGREIGAPHDMVARFDAERAVVLGTGRPTRGSVCYPTTHGEREFEYTFAPLLDDNGSVEAVLFTGVDVSDRNQRERERRRLDATLRHHALAFENMYDALIITDLEGRILECNAAFLRLSGYSREEALGSPISMLPPPKKRVRVMARISEEMRRDGRWEGEVWYRRKDGSQGISLTSVVPLRDEDGNVLGTLGINRDITERKATEQELRARAEREALLGRIGQAVLGTPDPAALQSTALSLLGERLGADRCFYVLYDESHNLARIEKDWCREGVQSLEGEWDLTERGMFIRDIYAGGQTVVVEDVTAGSLSPSLVRLFLETGQRSYIAVPFFDQGRPVAALTVMMATTARAWSGEEVALVEAAAVQVRGTVEAMRAAQREREAQELQRAFLRDVLASVTEGHLILCDSPSDLPPPLAPVGGPVALSRTSGLGELRQLALDAAAGMAEARRHDLVTAVSEAGMNAVTHGGGQGTGQVSLGADGTVQVRVEDQGAGIALESLPKATLARGFSTKASLGHGFKMMQQVDRVYVLTGPRGTTVVMEQGRQAPLSEAWLGESLI